MSKKEDINDLIGKKFNRLTILKEVIRQSASRYVLCRCDCGNEKVVALPHVKNGSIKSCGCYNRDIITKHGLRSTPEYVVWKGIKARCGNPKAKGYCNYGGRGITICDHWKKSFKNFYDDMGPRPSKRHSLNRINNYGNYDPGNCEWATLEEQANNKRSNRLIEYNGKTQTLTQWAKEYGISKNTLINRLKLGWSIEDALTKDPEDYDRNRVGIITLNTVTNNQTIYSSIAECAHLLKIGRMIIIKRLDTNIPYNNVLFRKMENFSGW